MLSSHINNDKPSSLGFFALPSIGSAWYSYALRKQRPQKVLQTIEAVTQEQKGESTHSYCFTRNDNYKYRLPGLVFETSRLKKAGTALAKVLDIGCGEGAWCSGFQTQNANLEVHGLSLHDFGNSHQLTHYSIANFENEACSLQEYNLIVSSFTFMHLIDPLAGLIKAYNALAPGGVLMVDAFKLPGIYNKIGDLIRSLREAGYIIAATFCDTEISSVMMVKTHDELLLPILYSGGMNFEKAEYRLINRPSLFSIADEALQKQAVNPALLERLKNFPRVQQALREWCALSPPALNARILEYNSNWALRAPHHAFLQQNRPSGLVKNRVNELIVYLNSASEQLIMPLEPPVIALMLVIAHEQDEQDQEHMQGFQQALGAMGFDYQMPGLETQPLLQASATNSSLQFR